MKTLVFDTCFNKSYIVIKGEADEKYKRNYNVWFIFWNDWNNIAEEY